MVLETREAWDRIKESVERSDKILIGLGADFSFENEGDFSEYRMAYKNLYELVKDKDYYVVSLCRDDFIYDIFPKEGNVVCPCGSFQRLQCEDACEKDLYVTEEICPDAIPLLKEGKWEEAQKLLPSCPKCGKKLVYNTIQTVRYIEEGYLEQWKKYKMWLQSTVNRSLCILELGAGMQFPGVIRFAFDKLAYYNQKADFYRVHTSLYQHTKENASKGVSIASNGVEFLAQAEGR